MDTPRLVNGSDGHVCYLNVAVDTSGLANGNSVISSVPY